MLTHESGDDRRDDGDDGLVGRFGAEAHAPRRVKVAVAVTISLR